MVADNVFWWPHIKIYEGFEGARIIKQDTCTILRICGSQNVGEKIDTLERLLYNQNG